MGESRRRMVRRHETRKRWDRGDRGDRGCHRTSCFVACASSHLLALAASAHPLPCACVSPVRCENQFVEKRLPTLSELDAAGGGRPVFVLHLYDCALVNRVGLDLLGYTKDTPNPPSGEIVRDEAGEPTGLLIARPNAFLLYNSLNLLPHLAFDEQLNSTRAYQRELHRFGLTSAIDPGGGFQNYPDDYGVVTQLDAAHELSLKIRFSLFPQKPGAELADFKRWSSMIKPGDGSAYLKHLGAGEMLAFSAADFEDFKEARPDLPEKMEADLEEIVRFLVSVRWPFRLHATYGESIERELSVFEAIARDDPTAFHDLRFFIDHAETISPRDCARIRALGGGIAIQHRMAFQGEYFMDRYGAEATQHSPPLGDMFAAGVPVGAGTDGTRVATYNPWVSLAWLVTGLSVGGVDLSPDASKPRNTVSRVHALHLWTHANAWFTREERTRGRLDVGFEADFAVLAEDYFTCSPEQLRDMEALLTVVDGRVVYAAAGASALNASVKATTQPELLPSWSPVARFGGYQIADSTVGAWKPTPESMVPLPTQQEAASTNQSAARQAVPVNPMAFFEHGHDC